MSGAAGGGGVCQSNGTLAAVAAIVARNCATSGCHDDVTHEHGMDLSTADGIHMAWVDRLGIDHCALAAVPRVVPEDSEASFVMTKIRGLTTCDLSKRMPPPPAAALTECEIDTIRRWIEAGAPPSPRVDAAADAADMDAAGDAEAAADADNPDLDPAVCSATRFCDPIVEICIDVGETSPPGVESCGRRWECFTHFDGDEDGGTLEHPCPAETAEFCGCDGVTFVRPWACPDRPYEHIGACGDGVDCDDFHIRCSDPKPACAEGFLAAVVDGCWGSCVPLATCRCEFQWQCTDPGKYRCRTYPDFRCSPL
jgi:hypothetical protein